MIVGDIFERNAELKGDSHGSDILTPHWGSLLHQKSASLNEGDRGVNHLLALATFGWLAASHAAVAQDFPTRPITVVVPYAPGASTDVVMRLVSQKVAVRFGQPIVVENRGGGGGTVAAVAVANASPDGYTLLMGNAGTHAIIPATQANLGYDPKKNFVPVSGIMSFASILVVPASSKAKSVADLIAEGKSKADGLTYASQSVGSGGHVLGEMFRTATGMNLVHVPYKGAAPALLDTMAGRADLLFASYISAKPYIEDGRLRVLGFTSAQRSPLLPAVPTMKEAGVSDVELDFWFGMFAPAKTPASVVTKLNEEFRRALAEPDVRQIIEGQAADIISLSASDFSVMVDKQGRQLMEIITRTGMKAR